VNLRRALPLAHISPHRASSHATRLHQLRPLPRHRRRSLRAPEAASTATLRLAGWRSRADRPVSAPLSWGARSSASTTPSAASGSASKRSWAKYPAALAATGLRRNFAAGWRACRDVWPLLLGVGPRLERKHNVRALPARACCPRHARQVWITFSPCGGTYGCTFRRLWPGKHAFTPARPPS
jgi:hypothetical protein